jgi:hypothetical protein
MVLNQDGLETHFDLFLFLVLPRVQILLEITFNLFTICILFYQIDLNGLETA